ncbi:hypothetical protein [uncultured Pseudacidovorax sp.]|uniref:hypothetical protein n=1 Tax=uncultured Pseudacidovorax sp. TaxID=679313 RepID=UPI0025F0EAD7|nr:hypothetical protein [uncultured Pseudacidovorax sp.]
MEKQRIQPEDIRARLLDELRQDGTPPAVVAMQLGLHVERIPGLPGDWMVPARGSSQAVQAALEAATARVKAAYTVEWPFPGQSAQAL